MRRTIEGYKQRVKEIKKIEDPFAEISATLDLRDEFIREAASSKVNSFTYARVIQSKAREVRKLFRGIAWVKAPKKT